MAYLSSAILRGTHADRPSSGDATLAGRLYFESDTNLTFRDSGTDWEAYSGTGGGEGHTIQDAGTSQTQRSKLNFIGATVADNSGSDSTDVTIASSVEYPKFQEAFFDDFVAYSGAGFSRDIASAYPFNWSMYSTTATNGDTWDIGIIIDAGTYTLKLWVSTGPQMGKVDISIDGESPISTFDGYSGSSVNSYIYTVSTGALSSGYHKIRFTVNGKNASSSSYRFYGSKLSIIPAAY